MADDEIKQMRARLGMSQSQFAKEFSIPLHNIQHWEQGFRTPPDYVVKLLKEVIEYRFQEEDNMAKTKDGYMVTVGMWLEDEQGVYVVKEYLECQQCWELDEVNILDDGSYEVIGNRWLTNREMSHLWHN